MYDYLRYLAPRKLLIGWKLAIIVLENLPTSRDATTGDAITPTITQGYHLHQV
eukprot:UN06697